MSAPEGPRGRGAAHNPQNRYEHLARELDLEALEDLRRAGELGPDPRTELSFDRSRSILSENDSPDLPFRWSLNPYRGCEHGCIYCYARPDHERLGFSAGLDFETRIVAKPEAARLLRAALRRPSWRGELIAIAGVTDAWQPVEAEQRITRACLEVMKEARQALTIVTKNRLLLRDLDLLGPMAAEDLVAVNISLTTLDGDLARKMEPRASSPEARLDTLRHLAAAGVPSGVMLGPLIPGLNDREIPALLEAARAAGARWATWLMLRLPGAVEALFVDWLEREFPGRKERILARLREVRGGDLHEGRFGLRNRGLGAYAGQIEALFATSLRRLGFDRNAFVPDQDRFRRPAPEGPRQLELFGDPES
ncbi:MAG: PA0069 family radical SAM protein [Planctomycetes bacterium]|nr:PA0069 family radical SAM protein [Planctomycetota bacterium]